MKQPFFYRDDFRGNYLLRKSWSNLAEMVYKRLSFRRLYVGEDQEYGPVEKIFPGFEMEVRPLTVILENQIITGCIPPQIMSVITDRTPIEQFLAKVLDRFGGQKIRYFSGIARSKDNVRERIASCVYVTDKGSMAMKDYLLFVACGKVPPIVLTEWSGIPIERQEEVFNGIIDFLRKKAYSINSEATTTQKKTEPEKILVQLINGHGKVADQCWC